MYDFFNRHFALGLAPEALKEQDYVPLSTDEATVWSGEYEQSRPTLNEAQELTVLRALDAGYGQQMARSHTRNLPLRVVPRRCLTDCARWPAWRS